MISKAVGFLIEAVMAEDVEEVIDLLAQGVDPNAYEDRDKIRPLHFVAQQKSAKALEIARILLGAGADPCAQTADRQTPMEIAELTNCAEMVLILLNAQKKRQH